MVKLTPELVWEYFDYDDGRLIWRKRASYKTHIGEEAGSFNADGYVQVGLLGGRWLAHRLIFMGMKGYLPRLVDHRDHNKANNRIENLRDLSYSDNIMNTPKIWSSTGYRGIRRTPFNKYTARIRKDGVEYHLGNFDTPEQAANEYAIARDNLYPGVFWEEQLELDLLSNTQR